MELSKSRRQLIKRALVHYQKSLLSDKYTDRVPAEIAKAEIEQSKSIIDDFNLIDNMENIDNDIPSGELIEEFINEPDDVDFEDMKIKPVKQC